MDGWIGNRRGGGTGVGVNRWVWFVGVILECRADAIQYKQKERDIDSTANMKKIIQAVLH